MMLEDYRSHELRKLNMPMQETSPYGDIKEKLADVLSKHFGKVRVTVGDVEVTVN
jgi:hypothetical protein